jgi:RNA polymerase sigma factor (sigma-70 family)
MSRLEEAIEIVKLQVKWYLKSHRLPLSIQPDDLLQEALVRMLRYISNYDPQKAELKTFLEIHTTGAIRDFLRKADGYSRGRGKTVLISLTVHVDKDAEAEKINDLPDPNANTEGNYLLANELPEFLQTAIKSLPTKYWLILLLYYWEEKSMDEIGELFEINESRVSQLHDDALNRLSATFYSMGIVRMSQLVGN